MMDILSLFVILAVWTAIIAAFCYPRWSLEEREMKMAGSPSNLREEVFVTVNICAWFATLPTLITFLIYNSVK